MHGKAAFLALAGCVLTRYKGIGLLRIKKQQRELESYIAYLDRKNQLGMVWIFQRNAADPVDKYIEVPWNTVPNKDWDVLKDGQIQQLIDS